MVLFRGLEAHQYDGTMNGNRNVGRKMVEEGRPSLTKAMMASLRWLECRMRIMGNSIVLDTQAGGSNWSWPATQLFTLVDRVGWPGSPFAYATCVALAGPTLTDPAETPMQPFIHSK